MKVATALATGRRAEPALAEAAVGDAMSRAGLEIAGTVLLFLSTDFARAPKPAILAAARTANSMQVTGCTATGVFTEEDWVLDAPAAAAMVLSPDATEFDAAGHAPWLLTLAAPNAIETGWLEQPGRRFGGVSGDATGQGPYKVWQNGKLASSGRCDTAFADGALRVDVSRGVEILSDPLLAELRGHELIALGDTPALAHLARQLPPDLTAEQAFPLPLLLAGIAWGKPETAVAEGRFHLVPLVAVNLEHHTVTLAERVPDGSRLFWTLRRPESAALDMRRTLDRLDAGATEPPRFGLCFPCIGRGPYFYEGRDRDLEQITHRFPGMPLLGFYGNGEFVHNQGRNLLMQYSTVLALRYDDVQS